MLLVNISAIGKTKVTMMNNKRGKTNKKALILFFLSVFFKLTLSGIPSVVKISFAVEIITSKKKRES